MNSTGINFQKSNNLVDKIIMQKKQALLFKPEEKSDKFEKSKSDNVNERMDKLDKKFVTKVTAATSGGLLLLGLGTFYLAHGGQFKKALKFLENKKGKFTGHPVAQKGIAGIEKGLNVVSNISTIKDATIAGIFKRAGKENGRINKFEKKVTGVFTKLAGKAGDKQIRITKSQFEKILDVAECCDDSNFSKKLDDIGSNLKSFCRDLRDLRKETDIDLDQVAKDYKAYYKKHGKGGFSKETVKNLFNDHTKAFMPDELIKPLKVKYQSKEEAKNTILTELNNLKLQIKDGKDLKKFEKEFKSFEKKINGLFDKESKNLLERRRDLKIGCAPVELLSLIVPIPLLAKSIVSGETAEDKKSSAIKGGLPLAGGVGAWIYASMFRLFAGPQALLFSIGSGLVSSEVAHVVDKKLHPSLYKKKGEHNQA